jgi:hypothetical protein
MKPAHGQHETFADILGLIEPLTTASFPAPAIEVAMQRARQLPAIPCGGFEFSLLDDDGVVDLMQSHAMDERGAARLVAYLDRSCDLTRQPWQWLRQIASQNRSGLANIWLEFDAKAGPNAPPSVFLEFDRRTHVPPARIHELLDTMPLANAGAQKAALERIVAALPQHASISHLGAMFSRADTPLRVNIKRLKSSELAGFVSRIGLDICTAQATLLMKRAYRATVCLDIIEHLLPRIGLEYTFSGWPRSEAGWRELSDIVSNGAVLENQWAAFHAWARVFTPIDTPDYWPTCSILNEICYPRDVSSIIECGPSHVKATYTPGLPTTLKAYVGFRPSLTQHDGTVIACDGPLIEPKPKAAAFAEAIARGVDFLMEERTQDGLWRDFDFASLCSDEWVSGYIGAHLLQIDHPAVRPAAASAWAILRQRRQPGEGWGYHRLTQPDADSTAWVLVLADRLGCADDPLVQANRDFLRAHLDENGAAATYSGRMLDRMAQPLPQTEAHEQWHGHHGEVTASAALAGLREAADNLLATQQRGGSWEAFWIASHAYSTGLACEALGECGRPAATGAMLAASRWALAQLADTRMSVFDLSWLIRAALCDQALRGHPSLAAAVRSLVDRQRDDGGWNGDCGLIVPIMDSGQSAIQTIEAPDIHGSFTTATALAALEKARRSGVEWKAS